MDSWTDRSLWQDKQDKQDKHFRECMSGWTDEQIDKWMNRQIDGWTDGWRNNGWMNRQTERLMDGWLIGGWTNGRMAEQREGRVDVWINEQIVRQMEGWMDEWTDWWRDEWRPLPFSYRCDGNCFLGAQFFLSILVFQVTPAAKVTRWHFYLTFLPPHSGNCSMRRSILPASEFHFLWMSSDAPFMEARQWAHIQDQPLNDFSQWEAIVTLPSLRCSPHPPSALSTRVCKLNTNWSKDMWGAAAKIPQKCQELLLS